MTAARSVSRRRQARRHGRRDGRDGLAVEEVADAPFFTSLTADVMARRQQEHDRLESDLNRLDSVVLQLARDLDRLLAERRHRIERSRRAAQALELEYRLLAAEYGATFLRHHRDRRFVHLGWRTPPLPIHHEEE